MLSLTCDRPKDVSGSRTDALYFSALLVFGAFFPSSTNGNVSYSLVALTYGLILLLLLYGSWRFGTSENAVIFCVLPILIILSLCTIFWALDDIRPAKFGIYAAIGAMFCLRWKSLPFTAGRRILLTISCLNVILGAAMMAGWEPATNAITRYYSVFFDDLVGQMAALHKPVLTYGSHAPAAFFLYCFYWMNFRTFQVTGNRLHLAVAIFHAILCAALFSHTSFVFAAFAAVEMGWCLVKYSLKYAVALVAVSFVAVPAIAAQFDPYLSSWNDLGRATTSAVSFVWIEQEGGIGGRFGAGGDMNSPVEFIKDHPFTPIGISTKTDEFTLIDSGPIEYMVRGSLPLLVLVYAGLWFFLRANLSRFYALRFYACILAMEFGFAILTFQRTLWLLPAFVAYLGTVERWQSLEVRKVTSHIVPPIPTP